MSKQPTKPKAPPAAAPDQAAGKQPPASPPAPKAEGLPDLIVLERDFGFTVNGVVRVWAAGIPITKLADIRELIAHDAPLKAYREV